MKLRRALIHSMTALSIIVCAATILWVVEGYRRNFSWVIHRADRSVTLPSGQRVEAHAEYSIATLHGQILVWWIDPTVVWTLDKSAVGWDPTIVLMVQRPLWNLLFISAVTAILPALLLRRILRRRRWNGPNCCTYCGYDLRASPMRCPECGELREELLAP